MRYFKNSDDSQDPDDMCVHCHAMIVGYRFRKCPFCGRIWWQGDNGGNMGMGKTARKRGK